MIDFVSEFGFENRDGRIVICAKKESGEKVELDVRPRDFRAFMTSLSFAIPPFIAGQS